MRLIPHPEADQLQLTGVLHALSDPVRLQIVWSLADGREVSCGRLAVDVSKSTLTHHLKVLRDAGLTHTRTEGVQRLVSLRRDDVERRFPGLLELVFSNAPVQVLMDAVTPEAPRPGHAAEVGAQVFSQL